MDGLDLLTELSKGISETERTFGIIHVKWNDTDAKQELEKAKSLAKEGYISFSTCRIVDGCTVELIGELESKGLEVIRHKKY